LTKPKRSRKPKQLLIDRIGPTLEERTAAWLQQHPPSGDDEFDRVCREAMTRYLDLLTEIRSRPKDGNEP
jgi:hypothetical protein